MKRLIRQIASVAFRALARAESPFDREYLASEIPMSRDISAQELMGFLQLPNGAPPTRVGDRQP